MTSHGTKKTEDNSSRGPLLLSGDTAGEDLSAAIDRTQKKLLSAIASVHGAFEELFELTRAAATNHNVVAGCAASDPTTVIAQPLLVGTHLTAAAMEHAQVGFAQLKATLRQTEEQIQKEHVVAMAKKKSMSKRKKAVAEQGLGQEEDPSGAGSRSPEQMRFNLLQQAIALQHDQLCSLLSNLNIVLQATPQRQEQQRQERQAAEANLHAAPDPLQGHYNAADQQAAEIFDIYTPTKKSRVQRTQSNLTTAAAVDAGCAAPSQEQPLALGGSSVFGASVVSQFMSTPESPSGSVQARGGGVYSHDIGGAPPPPVTSNQLPPRSNSLLHHPHNGGARAGNNISNANVTQAHQSPSTRQEGVDSTSNSVLPRPLPHHHQGGSQGGVKGSNGSGTTSNRVVKGAPKKN